MNKLQSQRIEKREKIDGSGSGPFFERSPAHVQLRHNLRKLAQASAEVGLAISEHLRKQKDDTHLEGDDLT